jgi:hypothetical protein
MGRDQEFGQFEWVNAWAEGKAVPTAGVTKTDLAKTDAAKTDLAKTDQAKSDLAKSDLAKADAPVARVSRAVPDDQLMRDIAEIERARDALAAMPLARSFSRRTEALTLVPARTTDPVPVVVGGVLALVMLTVFGAAAAMTRLAR